MLICARCDESLAADMLACPTCGHVVDYKPEPIVIKEAPQKNIHWLMIIPMVIVVVVLLQSAPLLIKYTKITMNPEYTNGFVTEPDMLASRAEHTRAAEKRIEYRYIVNGQDYISEEARLKRGPTIYFHQVGTRQGAINVYYDAADPSISTVYNPVDLGQMLGTELIGGLFLLCAMFWALNKYISI